MELGLILVIVACVYVAIRIYLRLRWSFLTIEKVIKLNAFKEGDLKKMSVDQIKGCKHKGVKSEAVINTPFGRKGVLFYFCTKCGWIVGTDCGFSSEQLKIITSDIKSPDSYKTEARLKRKLQEVFYRVSQDVINDTLEARKSKLRFKESELDFLVDELMKEYKLITNAFKKEV